MDFRYSVIVTLHKGCLAITDRYRNSLMNKKRKKENCQIYQWLTALCRHINLNLRLRKKVLTCFVVNYHVHIMALRFFKSWEICSV